MAWVRMSVRGTNNYNPLSCKPTIFVHICLQQYLWPLLEWSDFVLAATNVPKIVEPTERNISTRVIPHVISVLVFPKSSARSVTVRETVKKSNASHDQAKKATRKKSHCCLFSMRSRAKGLGALAIGGFKVVNLVAAYLPIVICRFDMSPSRSSSG